MCLQPVFTTQFGETITNMYEYISQILSDEVCTGQAIGIPGR